MTATTMVLADGATTVIGLLLEFLSRMAVYPCRYLCASPGHRGLPVWSVLLSLLTYIVGVGELGLWVLSTYLKLLPASFSNYAFLGALGAGIILRALHNVLLFFNFPGMNASGGHHKYKATTCGMLNRLFWKTLLFIAACAGMLIPLYYWFVVPTLQRSAFWVFCETSSTLVAKIQCYIGIIGLWIPLISVILIMDFIAYAIILSLYGAYLAQANHVGLNSAEEAAISVISGFQVFSALIKRWSRKSPLKAQLESDAKKNIDIGADHGASDVGKSDGNVGGEVGEVIVVGAPPTSSKKIKKSKKSKKSDDASKKDATEVNLSKRKAEPLMEDGETTGMRKLWFLIVDDLVAMDLISHEMAKSLNVALNWQELPLGTKPKEIIQFFFSSLGAFSPGLLDSLPENYLQALPPLSQLIPSYGEAVIFTIAYLCDREKKPITNLEFLVLKYPKEWLYFYQRMKLAFGSNLGASYGTSTAFAARETLASSQHLSGPPPSSYAFPSSEDEMLLWSLQIGAGATSAAVHNRLHPDMVDEIRLWASFRGQTLYKTIRGTISYRVALAALFETTNYGSEAAIGKSQVILAHQQYGDPSTLRTIANDILLVYKNLSTPHFGGRTLYGDTPFDLVFDWSPRDLANQQAFRKELRMHQNEEDARRLDLNSMLLEVDRNCSFGEALKKLVDLKAGDCPIDPRAGFPFASVLSGLPPAIPIRGKTWLLKYKGQSISFLTDLANGSSAPGASNSDASSPLSEEDVLSESGSSRGRSTTGKKNEVFRWDCLGSGNTTIHSPSSSPAFMHSTTAPAWLRFFNTETGREFDFLLRRMFCDVKDVVYLRVNTKAEDRSDNYDQRHYAVLIFGVRSSRSNARPEVFAIVTCLNEDSARAAPAQPDLAGDEDSMEAPLRKMDAQRVLEIQSIQRALTHKSFIHAHPDRHTLTPNGAVLLDSFAMVHDIAAAQVVENALLSDSLDSDIFLGIDVKAVLPRRNPLLMRVAGEMPFGEPDRIQGKAANQMNALRFAFGLIIQTKDANQGGNVAEALKFPFVLAKFETHLARDHQDQIKHIGKWCKKHLQSAEAKTIIAALKAPARIGKNDQVSPLLPSSDNPDHVPLPIDSHLDDAEIELVERSSNLGDSYERDSKRVILPPAIVGFREAIFTRGHGAVARFQAYAEWAFGTIVQRVLAKIGLRMHYGHPDFFSAAWVYSRSSISKANPVYNLSEDIFAGYTALLNERKSVHTDKIQDEKGRDTSLGSTYTFNAKLAQGAASQMKSRDVFWMNSRLDFLRSFLLFHTSLGYYFTTTAMLSSVKMYLFGLLVFSLAGYSAENLGNLQFIYSVPFLVQVGMFTLLPLVLEVGVEEGVWSVLKVIFDLPLSLGYFLFQGQTTTHHFIESFTKGKSHYEATGRLLGVSRKSLVDSYQLYGRSHLEPAMDYLYYVVVYYIVSSSRFGGYLPLFAPIICVVVFIIAPTGFQLGFSLKGIFNDIGDFGRWVFSTDSYASLLKEWKAVPIREQMIKNLTWKATFKASHSRLQTHSIFNNVKSTLSTHWRVDFASGVLQLFRVAIWGFIIVSIPGTKKDSVLKILIAFFLYLMLAMALAASTPQSNKKRKGCWRSFSNLFFVLSLAYFVALFVILSAWRYLGDCTVGVFLSVKLLKSLAWALFHFYALFSKTSTSRRWKSVEKQAASSKITQEEKVATLKELKSNLEKRMIGGLYLVETVDRPILMISISVVLIPIHAVWSILWAIPYVSEFLLYSIPLRAKVHLDELTRNSSPPWSSMMMMNPFNSFAGPDDFNELPNFDFDDDFPDQDGF